MKKTGKIIKKLLVTIIILIVLLVVAFKIVGNSILKTAIETAATKTLNVAVTLDDVKLSLLAGQIETKNLAVSNPAGFEHDHIFELGNMLINVQTTSLLSDTINIERMTLDGLNVVIEQKGLSNNLHTLIKSMPKAEPSKEEKPEQPAEPQKPGKNLKISELEITNIHIKAKLLPIAGKADTVEFSLPPIKMKDIGGDKKIDTAALVKKILTRISTAIAEKSAGRLPQDIIGPIKSSLGEQSEAVIEKSKQLLEETKDVGKELTEGLKSIFKKKEE